MFDEMNPSLVNVAEGDFLFRAEKLWRLLEILRDKELELSSKADWNKRFKCPDEYEEPLHEFRYIEDETGDAVKVTVMDDQDKRHPIIVDRLWRMRALCFGSDPDKVLDVHRGRPTKLEDIRIVMKINVRKLLDAAQKDPREYIHNEVTIGKVEYETKDGEVKENACRVLEAFIRGDGILIEHHKHTFFLKRKKFHVEDERRLIVLVPSSWTNDQTVKIEIDPFELIEEIIIDRLVPPSTERTIRDQLEQAGYPKAKIKKLR